MPSLKQLQSALEPHLGERTEAILEEGLSRLGLSASELSDAAAANLLKRVVYRELQREMDAATARKIVKEVLANLASDGGQVVTKPDPKSNLRAALSRFSLYFEWPEVQRLRSLAALIEASENEGHTADDLLKEAQAQIDLLDEKLQNSLLRQARDISDLEDALARVKSIGGPKLRRLQSLLKQIKEAQTADTLATAEVEQARKLAADMRKLVESSVVQNPTLVPEGPEEEEDGVIAIEDDEPEMAPEDEGFELLIDFESLEPEVADRIREIDLAEEQRRLELLQEQYAAVWNTASVSNLVAEIETLFSQGQLAAEKLDELQQALDEATKEALAEARARYEWLSERLHSLNREEGLATGRAHSQLELIKESLDLGILPGDLEEAERQIRSLEESLAQRRAEEARRARVLEEARSLAANARQALNGSQAAELAGFRERLDLLEEGLAADDVDEALLARLKDELPEVLKQIAQVGEATKALRARLIAEIESLPPLEELQNDIETLRLQVEELPPEELETAVTSLRQRALALAQTRLRQLAERAASFQLPTNQIAQAEAELERGKLPQLDRLEQEIAAAIATKQREVKQNLEAMAANARRFEGMGGEELLPEIEAALTQLNQELPDTATLQLKLNQLLEEREGLRKQLQQRFQEVAKRYERASTVGGETAYRLRTLLNFLEKGAGRLNKLGTSGLREFERALGEAEKLIQQLEEEYTAAKQVAQQLQGVDLDDLLGVFDSPAGRDAADLDSETVQASEPAPTNEDALAPFRIRGVLWAHKLSPSTPAPEEVDIDLIQALAEDLDLLREEVGFSKTRITVITLPDHVLLVSPLADGLAVILAEKSLLSRLVSLADRHLKEAS